MKPRPNLVALLIGIVIILVSVFAVRIYSPDTDLTGTASESEADFYATSSKGGKSQDSPNASTTASRDSDADDVDITAEERLAMTEEVEPFYSVDPEDTETFDTENLDDGGVAGEEEPWDPATEDVPAPGLLDPELSAHIIIETDEEARYFANGCAFFDLRDTLAGLIARAEWEEGAVGIPATLGVRMVGNGDQRALEVGEYWIAEGGRFAYFPVEELDPVFRANAARPGPGDPLDGVDAYVSSALIDGSSGVQPRPVQCAPQSGD